MDCPFKEITNHKFNAHPQVQQDQKYPVSFTAKAEFHDRQPWASQSKSDPRRGIGTGGSKKLCRLSLRHSIWCLSIRTVFYLIQCHGAKSLENLVRLSLLTTEYLAIENSNKNVFVLQGYIPA